MGWRQGTHTNPCFVIANPPIQTSVMLPVGWLLNAYVITISAYAILFEHDNPPYAARDTNNSAVL